MAMHAKRCGYLLIAATLFVMMGGCSIFISTPQMTRIQVQGVDDQLWEYVVMLDDPMEDSLGIQISDNYTLQFDFEWLWNSQTYTDLYLDLNAEYGETDMAPWMLCKYRF